MLRVVIRFFMTVLGRVASVVSHVGVCMFYAGRTLFLCSSGHGVVHVLAVVRVWFSRRLIMHHTFVVLVCVIQMR